MFTESSLHRDANLAGAKKSVFPINFILYFIYLCRNVNI